MIEMICPTTGIVIRVPEDRVEKLQASGYKKVEQKPARSTRKKSE